MVGSAYKRFIASVMLAVFLAFLVVHGAGLTTAPPVAGKKACLVKLDVCGHAGLAHIQNIEFPFTSPSTFNAPIFESYYPPIPDQAVASADPGETFKPPKA